MGAPKQASALESGGKPPHSIISRACPYFFLSAILTGMGDSFVEKYKASHRHPLNQLTHYIGIPMIVVSLPVFVWDWRWALALFVLGWIFQFAGHFIEGNQPAFFRNPIYLLIGPAWLL